MKITCYTYDADVHCVSCAKKRFRPAGFRTTQTKVRGLEFCDENLIPYNATDREGNKITPVFSTDETNFTHCGTCQGELT